MEFPDWVQVKEKTLFMSHLLHFFPLISLHELTPISDAYQWNAHDHLEVSVQLPAFVYMNHYFHRLLISS